MFLVSSLLLLCLSAIASAQETSTVAPTPAPAQWAGCFDETTRIKIGEPMFLCLHVANGINWADGVDYVRLTFSPNADEYSRFHVPNCTWLGKAMGCFMSFQVGLTSLLFFSFPCSTAYNDLRINKSNSDFSNPDTSLTVGVGVQTSLSFLRLWAGNSNVYPHMTVIIDVKDGIVRGITWDDACIFCGGGLVGESCDEITYDFNGDLQTQDSAAQPTRGCGTPESDCARRHRESGTDCDLVLYVVWTGTDIDGNAMLSSANRFSAFPAQKLQDRLTQNLPGIGRDPTRDL